MFSASERKEWAALLARVYGLKKKGDIQNRLESIIYDFNSKLLKKPISHQTVELVIRPSSMATLDYDGEIYTHDVDGHCALVGTVYYEDGTLQKIFQRFISHPFWQYSSSRGRWHN